LRIIFIAVVAVLVASEGQGQWFAEPKTIEEFFGKPFSVERSSNGIVATTRPESIWSAEAAIGEVIGRIDRLGKWLQTPEGRTVTEKIIKITLEAPTQDRFGNPSDRAIHRADT